MNCKDCGMRLTPTGETRETTNRPLVFTDPHGNQHIHTHDSFRMGWRCRKGHTSFSRHVGLCWCENMTERLVAVHAQMVSNAQRDRRLLAS